MSMRNRLNKLEQETHARYRDYRTVEEMTDAELLEAIIDACRQPGSKPARKYSDEEVRGYSDEELEAIIASETQKPCDPPVP